MSQKLHDKTIFNPGILLSRLDLKKYDTKTPHQAEFFVCEKLGNKLVSDSYSDNAMDNAKNMFIRKPRETCNLILCQQPRSFVNIFEHLVMMTVTWGIQQQWDHMSTLECVYHQKCTNCLNAQKGFQGLWKRSSSKSLYTTCLAANTN